MARETALQRTKRELRDAEDYAEHLRNRYTEVCDENRRLRDRCSFLYDRAMEFANEHAATRLRQELPVTPQGRVLRPDMEAA